MANSDHWLCISNPRCLRISWKVTSNCQRITNALKAGEDVQLPGFGKFYVREQKAREGRNPQSGEKMNISARKVPAFKAGKSFKESI